MPRFVVAMVVQYEYLTAFRDEKRATLSVLLQALTVAYWGCFNDRICPSYPLLQHSSCALSRGWAGRASTTPLKLVPFGHYHGMRWQALWTMDHNIHCTVLLSISYRSILYPSEKESCMGSNSSSAFFDHVQWRWKSTELQILEIHCCQCAKWWFLL